MTINATGGRLGPVRRIAARPLSHFRAMGNARRIFDAAWMNFISQLQSL